MEIARDAMQIHGGMGYIDETGVHKYLRDALVMPVYEGTTQIQSLMATKDHLLWAAQDPAGFLRRGARARLLARTGETHVGRQVFHAEALTYAATETIMLRIFGKKVRADWEGGLRGKAPADWGKFLARKFLRHWDVKADFSQGLLHAERLAQMLTEVAIGKVLLKQAKRFPERQQLAERFVSRSRAPGRGAPPRRSRSSTTRSSSRSPRSRSGRRARSRNGDRLLRAEFLRRGIPKNSLSPFVPRPEPALDPRLEQLEQAPLSLGERGVRLALLRERQRHRRARHGCRVRERLALRLELEVGGRGLDPVRRAVEVEEEPLQLSAVSASRADASCWNAIPAPPSLSTASSTSPTWSANGSSASCPSLQLKRK